VPKSPGFVTYSFAGDDWKLCNDHVGRLLGVDASRRTTSPRAPRLVDAAQETAAKRRMAMEIWNHASDPRSTIAEHYLNHHRGLELAADIAGSVLRFSGSCPFGSARAPALIALFRDIHTDAPQAIQRTRLDPITGAKVGDRMTLGSSKGAAIKLDPDDSVLAGLHLGEGVETVLTGRQFLGMRPAWAMGGKGGIASFSLLSGIQALTLFEEDDSDSGSAMACARCGDRWDAGSREVWIVPPRAGLKDINDAVKRRR
jgi:putative DNA primase/helicase